MDDYTNELFIFSKVDKWLDGSKLDKSKVDDIIFLEKNGNFYKREYIGDINAKWFGAKGDGLTDDYNSIQKAILFAERLGKGNIFIPQGIYFISQKIIISKPFIGLHGEGINNTIIKAKNDALQLSPYSDVSSATISNITLNGNNTGIGIYLKNSNFYFIEKVRISNFANGILGETAVLNKISNFYIISCNNGISFNNGSYFSSVSNGTITACKEVGIKESGSRILIDKIDIESIPNGIGIIGGSQTEIRDVHIESCNAAIGIDTSGFILVDNAYIIGCKYGVQRLTNKAIYGNFHFNNMRFSETEKEFEIPNLPNTTLNEENIISFDNKGGIKKLYIKI